VETPRLYLVWGRFGWGKHGITVNCLAPGWFRTEQNRVLYKNEEWVDYLCDRIPLKRPGEPHDLDAAVIFLAAESSRYITKRPSSWMVESQPVRLALSSIPRRPDQAKASTGIRVFTSLPNSRPVVFRS
jgi:hypothetical protein